MNQQTPIEEIAELPLPPTNIKPGSTLSLKASIQEALPDLKRLLLVRAEQFASRYRGGTPWHNYGVDISDVLCWPACGPSSMYLRERLVEQGFLANVMIYPALPLPAVPFGYRRSAEVFAVPHMLIHATSDGTLQIIDANWRQFVTFLLPSDKCRELLPLLEGLGGEILVLTKEELPRFCRLISEFVASRGSGLWNSSFSSIDEMTQHFLSIWAPSSYRMATANELKSVG